MKLVSHSLDAYARVLFLSCYIIAFQHASSAHNQGNETDQLALLAFKSGIKDDPFQALGSWNESIHFCRWRGVICSSRHQRVTTLDLRHQKLQGPLTPHMGNLSFLNEFLLDNNSFTGEIPTELGRLRRLELLWLRNNSFSGEIPGNLSACSSLREIRLSWNNLVGNLPMELGALSNLQLIQAPRNNLTGNIPRSFGNLSLLEFIGFSSNSLSGSIPDELGRLSKLEYIGFNENRLSGKFPPSIFNLSSITTVFVSLNQLQGTLPRNIGATLPNLSYFSIEVNQFTGSIPASISNRSNLKYLLLDANKFSGKVPSFRNLYNLVQVDLSSNLLGSGEPDDLSFISSLTNASDLKELRLGGNNFGGVLPESFSNLSTKLTGLYLSNNQLSGSLPGWLSKFVNMTNIEIGSNEFTGNIPASIGELSKLHVLDLSRNRFTGRIPSFIGNLSMSIGLKLDGNHFTGEIPPSLGQCMNLQALNLSKNMLNGTIPRELLGLSSLVLYLDLSHNQLKGPLPLEVGNLENLGELYVSRNMLSGEIPSTLDKCMSLEKLYMNGNFFHGTIPSSLSSLRGIRLLDLSENNLSGEIPEFLGGFDLQYLNLSYNAFEGRVPEEGIFRNSTAVSVVGNHKLCGGVTALRLPRCSVRKSEEFVSTFTFKLVISIVSGFLVISLLFVFLFLYRRRSKKVPSRQSSGHLLPTLSYDTLYQATDGFSLANLIGTGSYASVYRGVIEYDGSVVAVKVFNLVQAGASKSWIAECKALRNIRHRNLLKVLTACSGCDQEGNEFKALVYEFMSNGSLERWLHPNSIEDPSGMEVKKLSFLQRLNVAFDVACAVDYLHHQSHEPIVHCDLKPSNVLLDEDLVAHVGDFGLARLLPAATRNEKSTSGLRGSIGYTAPEYGIASKVSTSGDVYSFGILLLEMFTGLRPTNNMFREGLNLHNYVRRALPDRVAEITDPVLLQENIEKKSTSDISRQNNSFTEGSKIQKDCLISVFQVGLACSADTAGERMDIRDAAAELNSTKNVFLGTKKLRETNHGRHVS